MLLDDGIGACWSNEEPLSLLGGFQFDNFMLTSVSRLTLLPLPTPTTRSANHPLPAQLLRTTTRRNALLPCCHTHVPRYCLPRSQPPSARYQSSSMLSTQREAAWGAAAPERTGHHAATAASRTAIRIGFMQMAKGNALAAGLHHSLQLDLIIILIVPLARARDVGGSPRTPG